MADTTDEVLTALAESNLASEAREVVLELLRDDTHEGGLSDPHLGPIYLTRIEVEGFRGIGPKTALELMPGKGLTLVVGPNGSGKSSFAEALERVVTGTTRRYEGATSDGQENWRNVHHDEATSISIQFQRALDSGPSSFRVAWAGDEGFREGSKSGAGPSGDAAPQWLAADWAAQLARYPPLLPYTELAAVIDGKPSELFDQFDRLLGLGMLDDAANQAGAAAKQAKSLLDAAKKARESAAHACAQSELDSVAGLVGRIRARDVQPTKLLLELAEHFGPGGRDARLASYMLLAPLNIDSLDESIEVLSQASNRVKSLESEQAVQAERTDELLAQALAMHLHHETRACPVCGVGQLDSAWRKQTQETLERHGRQLAALRDARSAVQRASADLVSTVTELLRLEPHEKVPSSSKLLERCGVLVDVVQGVVGGHGLRAEFASLAELVVACKAEATASHDSDTEAAQPAIEAVTAWVAAEDVIGDAAVVKAANEAAREWLRSRIQVLRDERLAGLGEQARQVWSELRSTSAVELGPLVLAGANTRRHLRLTCTTEGADAMARSVLSQGELHAIALSLFIPRALHSESPFGFLVVDDPVQALDRLKIDGLADVLHRLARSRQVVVFTHDDRLPDAVLRLGHAATILRVERAAGSTVSVQVSDDAATRALRDAATLARDEALDEDLASRAVAGCCRAAVEARAVQQFRLTAASRGLSVSEIDEVLADAGPSLWNRVSLALVGEISNNTRQVLESRNGVREARLLSQLNSKGHDRQTGRMTEPLRLLEETRFVLDGLLAP